MRRRAALAAREHELVFGRTSRASFLVRAQLLLQRRGGRQLKVKQRYLVIKKRLIETGQRFAPSADRIQQFERRAFAGFQRKLSQVLNFIDLAKHACAVKLDAPLLNVERY